LLALGRIHRGDKSKAHLLGDHRTCNLQRGECHPRGGTEHDTDNDLMHHQHQQRRQRSHVDMISGTVQRQDDQCQHYRDRELDAYGDVGLTQSRQQHHHGANAGEYQHESRGKRRQQ
jgi:hypothetical protein